MQIYGSNISCGMYQLYIGDGTLRGATPTVDEYKAALKAYCGREEPQAGFIVASFTSKQVKAIDFVLSQGYVQVGGWRRNPNSGNDIAVFVKTIGDEMTPARADCLDCEAFGRH